MYSNIMNNISVKKLKKNLTKIIVSNPQLGRFYNIVDKAQRTKLIMLNRVFDQYIESGNKSILPINKSKNMIKKIIKKDNAQAEYAEMRKKKKIVKNTSIERRMITLNRKNINDHYQWTHKYQLQMISKTYPNSLYQQIVRFYQDGVLLHSMNIDTKDPYNKKFIDRCKLYFSYGEEYWIVAEFLKNKDFAGFAVIDENLFNRKVDIVTIAYTKVKNINQGYIIQTFRDNENGTCVYDGVLQYFKNKSDIGNNKPAKGMYNALIREETKYKKAYTDVELSDIAKFVKASIKIVDLVNGNNKNFNESSENRYCIEFINSRFNHLDFLSHSYDEVKKVSKDEYNSIKFNSSFYIEKYGKLYAILDGVTSLYSVIESPFKIMFDNWKKENNLNILSICSDNEVMPMLEDYDFSIHRFFDDKMIIDNSLYKELDMKKAYYNYSDSKYNKYYMGVPSGAFLNFKCVNNFTIDNFNEITSNKLTGFYQVEILTTNYELNKLGFSIGSTHTLFTSMIVLLKEYITFDFINVSYSPSVHIPFTEEFIEVYDKKNDTDKGIRGYCKAFGLMMMVPTGANIEIKPMNDDTKYYNLINDDNTEMYISNGVIKMIKTDVKLYTHLHIASAINAYCKTILLEQMLTMDINDIFGVKLDSIVYRGNVPVYNDYIFSSSKKCKIEGMLRNKKERSIGYDLDFGLDYATNYECSQSRYYEPYFLSGRETINFKINFVQTGEIINNRVVKIGGKGGAGKTYSLLNHLQLNTVIYSANAWNLIEGQQKKTDKKFIGLSIPKLTGRCNGKKVLKVDNKDAKIIILDEATLNNKNDVEFIIKKFYWCYIFLLGDIDRDGFYYQCSIDKNIYTDFSKCQYIEYTKTYRFDDMLDAKLNCLRQKMRDYDGNINMLNEYVKEEYKNNYIKREDIIFLDTDVGISSCNDMGEHSSNISEYFVNKGSKPQYYVKKTDLYKGLLKGSKLDEKPSHNNYECKLFKTIHSFQGLDIGHDQRIIIYFDKIFDYNLFYTAFSRARRLDQIVIII